MLWKPEVYYRVHQAPHLVRILSQIRVNPSCFFMIYMNVTPSTPGFSKWSLSFKFPTKIPGAFLFFLVRAIFSAHLTCCTHTITRLANERTWYIDGGLWLVDSVCFTHTLHHCLNAVRVSQLLLYSDA